MRVAVACVGLLGCIDAVPAPATVGAAGYAYDLPPTSSFDAVDVLVKDFRLLHGSSCSDEMVVTASGGLIVIEPETPGPGGLEGEVPAQMYCGFAFQWTEASAPGTGAPIPSLRHTGRRLDGAYFIFDMYREDRVEFRAPAPFVAPSGPTTFLLGIKMSALLEGIDIDALPRERLLHDEELSARLAANAPQALHWFVDANRDGEIDPGERDTILADD